MIISDKFIYSTIWDWESLELLTNVLSISKNCTFIYNCQQEYEIIDSYNSDILKKIADLSIKNNISILLIFGSLDLHHSHYPKEFLDNVKVIYDPTYWLRQTINSIPDHIQNFKTPEYQHLFCCFVNKPKKHRCEFIDELYNSKANELGYHTWNNLTPYYEFKHWKQTIIKSSDKFKTEKHFVNNWILTSSEYNNALLDLVLETTDSCTFFTEKTYKPIVLKKLFLIYGCPLNNQNLKHLGFELYDEIIDYSFDFENDNIKRAKLLCEELKRLSKYKNNYNVLYEKVKYKIEHNFNTALYLSTKRNLFEAKNSLEHLISNVDLNQQNLLISLNELKKDLYL